MELLMGMMEKPFSRLVDEDVFLGSIFTDHCSSALILAAEQGLIRTVKDAEGKVRVLLTQKGYEKFSLKPPKKFWHGPAIRCTNLKDAIKWRGEFPPQTHPILLLGQLDKNVRPDIFWQENDVLYMKCGADVHHLSEKITFHRSMTDVKLDMELAQITYAGAFDLMSKYADCAWVWASLDMTRGRGFDT